MVNTVHNIINTVRGGGICTVTFELEHSVSYNIACVPSEDSDQSAHPRSLIIVFAGQSESS